jgi:LmbE family N-acetylglucosaminyl deacetylase
MAMTFDPRGIEPAQVTQGSGEPVRLRASDRLLVLAPHPDDESLATGGLLGEARAAGAQIHVVFLTDGDRNPWAQLVYEGRWPVGSADRARWGRRRRAEVRAALAQLGVHGHEAEFLGFPDQQLTDLLLQDGRGVQRAIKSALDDWRPTVLALPSPADAHPDHSATAVAAGFAMTELKPSRRPAQVLHYCVHRGSEDPAETRWVPLDHAGRERKRRAILCHVTQLWWRRRQLLEFVREREGFESAAASAWNERHPIRLAFFNRGALHLEFRTRRLRLGPATLRVVIRMRNGPGARWSVVLPTWRSKVAVRDEVTKAVVRVVPLVGGSGLRRLAIGIPRAARLQGCFVKLEWPMERRLGFFDRAGWRAVPLPRSDGAGTGWRGSGTHKKAASADP